MVVLFLVQVAEVGFLQKVHSATLCNTVHRHCEICKALNVKKLLL